MLAHLATRSFARRALPQKLRWPGAWFQMPHPSRFARFAFAGLVSGTLLATLQPMKRVAVTVFFLSAVATLGGCPIYSHDDQGCFRDSDCASGYACDELSGACYLPDESHSCRGPADCGTSKTCGRAGLCVVGDCSFNGCVAGFECDSSSGLWECVAQTAGAAGSSSAGAGGSSGAEDVSEGASGAGAGGTSTGAGGTTGAAGASAGQAGGA